MQCIEPEFENDSTNSHFSQDIDKAFFIESSGNCALSYRQACAVESLALHNPNLTVNVLFTNADINAGLDNIPQKLVENYVNIQLISINVDEYMAGTLMEHWYQCTNWRSGSYHVNNLSNALRLLTVYKFGGYYFDLDIISVRPVTSYRNFVAAVDPEIVNNNVIHADAKHAFIELAIYDFVTNFRQLLQMRHLMFYIDLVVNQVPLSALRIMLCSSIAEGITRSVLKIFQTSDYLSILLCK